MKFIAPRPRKPFANPFRALLVHGLAALVFFGAILVAYTHKTTAPLWRGAGVLVVLEGVWWYFHLRRSSPQLQCCGFQGQARALPPSEKAASARTLIDGP